MKKTPKLSLCIPIHRMKNADFFLSRLQDSIEMQSFTDFELVVSQNGKMAENTNASIRKASGELIKILFMDDFFAHETSLQNIVDIFDKETEWLMTATDDNISPYWTSDILEGNNRLGSPSALTFRNHFEDNLYFDNNMSFLLDCDLYYRLYQLYGQPKILSSINVCMGIGDHQTTHLMSQEEKIKEFNYLSKKYA